MYRKLVIVAITGLLAALIVPTAGAAKPTIQRISLDYHAVNTSCGFPVQLDAVGTIVDISYTDGLGTIHDFEAAPQAKETMTNVATGKSIVVNIAGPADFTFGADGSFKEVGGGNSTWGYGDPRTLGATRGIFLSTGRFVWSISASGVESWTISGKVTNLCTQLASS